jgi:hypothetical protein
MSMVYMCQKSNQQTIDIYFLYLVFFVKSPKARPSNKSENTQVGRNGKNDVIKERKKERNISDAAPK